jgi:N-acetylmuramoyl-L-alanine amidase
MKRRVKGERMKRELWVALGACVLGLVLLMSAVQTKWSESQAISTLPEGQSPLRSATLSVEDFQGRSTPVSSVLPETKARATPKKTSKNSARSTIKLAAKPAPKTTKTTAPVQRKSEDVHYLLEVGCLEQPDRSRPLTPQELEPVTIQLPLTRFRSTAAQFSNAQESVLMAHPSNFGWRYLKDVSGNPVSNAPIVVLHETVGSYESAIGMFQSAHEDEDDQVSYHALIREDGRIVYTVPSDRRAYGAGNSVFVNSARQEEAVKTNAKYPPSVNNFAYHISLVSPEDAYDSDEPTHSGYTKAQYESLAWLVSKTGVPEDRITTHQLIDRSGSRMDPRSFNVPYFLGRLRTYPISQEIAMVCAAP